MPDTDDTDPSLDLGFERIVPVSAADLWRGWTDPALLTRWFTPAPWVTLEAEIDPRPGGIFRTVMAGPDGERSEGPGCVLAAEPGRLLVWTSALGPDFRPLPTSNEGFAFTATIEFEEIAGGTRYRATVRHATPEDAASHAEMGFEAGWGAALDQLVALLAR